MQQIYRDPIEVKLSQIEWDGTNPRQLYDDESIEALMLSIKEDGLLQPVQLKLLPNGKYSPKDGQRRIRAYERLHKANPAKYETISAVVVPQEMTDIDLLEDSMVDIMHRRDIPELDKAIAIEKWVLSGEKSKLEISNALGQSQDWLTTMLKIAEDSKKANVQLRRQASKRDLSLIAKVKASPEKKDEVLKAIEDLPYSQRVKILNKFGKDPDTLVENLVQEGKAARGGGLISVKIMLPQTAYDYLESQAKQFSWRSTESYIAFSVQQTIQFQQAAQALGTAGAPQA